MNPAVDWYFQKAGRWQEALEQLRTIALDCGLAETLKWGVPGYTHEESNVVLLHTFKEYCALLFVKGALLTDANGVLIQQTKNTQAARQLRFTSVEQVFEQEAMVKAYIQEAIQIEKAGLTVAFKKADQFAVPQEFADKLTEDPVLQTAFNGLTPGRQRAYLLYFSAPKQAKTRASRVGRCVPHILRGQGLHDEPV